MLEHVIEGGDKQASPCSHVCLLVLSSMGGDTLWPLLFTNRLPSMSISKFVDCERRAFEKIPRKGKEFDPAESGGHNLLEEMSLPELRQRLAYTKQRHQVYLTG